MPSWFSLCKQRKCIIPEKNSDVLSSLVSSVAVLSGSFIFLRKSSTLQRYAFLFYFLVHCLFILFVEIRCWLWWWSCWKFRPSSKEISSTKSKQLRWHFSHSTREIHRGGRFRLHRTTRTTLRIRKYSRYGVHLRSNLDFRIFDQLGYLHSCTAISQ